MSKRLSWLGWCAATVMAGPLLADTVSIRPSDAPPNSTPTVYTDVKVTGVDSGQLKFTTSGGNDVAKDFITVVGLTLDDEPGFNQAEDDYNAGKYGAAVDEFSQTMQKTDKPWLKDYCLSKLADAANKAGRFDKAVESYLAMMNKNPKWAAKHKPAIPAAGSSYLDGAAAAVSAAADAPGIQSEQQETLLAFLLEIQKARGDNAAVDAVARRITKTATLTGDTHTAGTVSALADAKLVDIHKAIDQKNFDQAADMVNGSKAMFTDPSRQAEALFLLAEAREGQAAAKGDDQSWQDAAIAYMRVTADFKDAPGKPHIADSLLHTAAILEKLKSNDEAMQTYLSVVQEFPGTPEAAKAQEQANRLKAATKPN